MREGGKYPMKKTGSFLREILLSTRRQGKKSKNQTFLKRKKGRKLVSSPFRKRRGRGHRELKKYQPFLSNEKEGGEGTTPLILSNCCQKGGTQPQVKKKRKKNNLRILR